LGRYAVPGVRPGDTALLGDVWHLRSIVGPIIDVGHFFMTRKHMLGLKVRAEVEANVSQAMPERAARFVLDRRITA